MRISRVSEVDYGGVKCSDGVVMCVSTLTYTRNRDNAIAPDFYAVFNELACASLQGLMMKVQTSHTAC